MSRQVNSREMVSPALLSPPVATPRARHPALLAAGSTSKQWASTQPNRTLQPPITAQKHTHTHTTVSEWSAHSQRATCKLPQQRFDTCSTAASNGWAYLGCAVPRPSPSSTAASVCLTAAQATRGVRLHNVHEHHSRQQMYGLKLAQCVQRGDLIALQAHASTSGAEAAACHPTAGLHT